MDTFSPNTRPLSSFPRAHNFGRAPEPSVPRARGGETWEDFFAAELGFDSEGQEELSGVAGGTDLDRVNSVAGSTASSGSFWANRLRHRTVALTFPSRRPSLPSMSLSSGPFSATARRRNLRPQTAPGPRPSTFPSSSLYQSRTPSPSAVPDLVSSPALSSPASSLETVAPPSLGQRVLYILSLGMAGKGTRRRAGSSKASGRTLGQTRDDGRGWSSVTGF